MPEEDAIFIAKVMKLGRITIPESVRELLDIQAGDIVQVRVEKRTPARDS